MTNCLNHWLQHLQFFFIQLASSWYKLLSTCFVIFLLLSQVTQFIFGFLRLLLLLSLLLLNRGLFFCLSFKLLNFFRKFFFFRCRLFLFDSFLTLLLFLNNLWLFWLFDDFFWWDLILWFFESGSWWGSLDFFLFRFFFFGFFLLLLGSSS